MQARLHVEVERACEAGKVLRQCRAQNDRIAVELLQRECSARPADQKPADDGIRASDGREIGEDGWGAEPDEGGSATQEPNVDVPVHGVRPHEAARRRLDLTPVACCKRLRASRRRLDDRSGGGRGLVTSRVLTPASSGADADERFGHLRLS